MAGPSTPGARARSVERGEELFAVTALGAIVAITFGWWLLALWPVEPAGATWVLRTRAVCFGSTESGLPDAEGWALLLGQPIGMLGVLVVGWRSALRKGLTRLRARPAGRVAAAAVATLVVAGLGGAGARVATAAAPAPDPLPGPMDADGLTRLDAPAPSGLELVDQSGARFDLARYRGRPVLVTFAFAHCETVCPVLVRDLLDAQERAGTGAARPALVVVTVDPWRDTPARLPHVAHQWELPRDAHVLSGPVDRVLGELEAWDVSISRDERTGEVIHPAVVAVLDRSGRLAFVTTGGGDHAVKLIERLDGR
jgi:protein SCO1/2